MQLSVALPRVDPVKCVTSRRKRRVEASAPDAPPSIALDTCPKKLSIKVNMRAVVGLSRVVSRLNASLSGWVQPVTHAGARTRFVQRSSQRMSMSDIADRTERVSGCAPSDLFKEAGNGSTEMRDTYVLVGALNVGTPNRVVKRGFGCSRGSGNLGGKHADPKRRNTLGVVTRHSQFAQPYSGGSNIHQGSRYLPLAY